MFLTFAQSSIAAQALLGTAQRQSQSGGTRHDHDYLLRQSRVKPSVLKCVQHVLNLHQICPQPRAIFQHFPGGWEGRIRTVNPLLRSYPPAPGTRLVTMPHIRVLLPHDPNVLILGSPAHLMKAAW